MRKVNNLRLEAQTHNTTPIASNLKQNKINYFDRIFNGRKMNEKKQQ